jgi:uncharacterized protein (DUF1697 family)
MTSPATTSYVALLRAVNVGGTGKLPMAELTALCQEIGFAQVRTYIASGNVLFHSDLSEAEVRTALNARLEAYAGKPVGTLVRTATEMAGVVARNPFADEPGNRVMALFTDEPIPPDALTHITGRTTEQLALGLREIFVFYDQGMAQTKLRIPAAKAGTARNMNTVATLAEMAGV